MAWWSDEITPPFRFALDSVDENQRGITAQTQGYLLGFAGADIARHVLAQTVKEVGLDRLSGETCTLPSPHWKITTCLTG